MSLYFLLGTLSSGGRTKLHNEPNLLVNCTRNVDIPGAEILGTYAVLGGYDYVLMVDADDNEAVAKISLEIGVGTGLHIETLPAIAIGFRADTSPGDPLDRPAYIQETPDRSGLT